MKRVSKVLLVFAILSVAQAAWPVERCGIVLPVPRHWRVSAAKIDKSSCEFDVDPPNWRKMRRESDVEMSDHAITISVSTAAFAAVARDAGFTTVAAERADDPDVCPELQPDAWLLLGGKGTGRCNRATPIRGAEFEGVAGTGSYGVMKKEGGYAGLGEYEMAVVTNHRISVRIDCGFPPSENAVARMAGAIVAKSQRPPN